MANLDGLAVTAATAQVFLRRYKLGRLFSGNIDSRKVAGTAVKFRQMRRLAGVCYLELCRVCQDRDAATGKKPLKDWHDARSLADGRVPVLLPLDPPGPAMTAQRRGAPPAALRNAHPALSRWR